MAALRRRIARGTVATAPPAVTPRPVTRLGRTLEVLRVWRRRSRYRRELARLMRSGPHLIDDIGLLRAHAEREVAKPFWRP